MTEWDLWTESLTARYRPEDLAPSILSAVGSMVDPTTRAALEALASAAQPKWMSVPTSMMSVEFEKVDDSRSQLETLERLAGLAGHDVSFSGLGEDPSAAMAAVESFGARVGWSPTVEPRRVPVSGRQARRLWRALDHTWEKLQRQARMSRVRHAVLTGRGALASRIEPADFRSDVLTAATITYLVARRNLRRQFTINGADGTTDLVLEGLLAACTQSVSTRWDLLAMVRPSPSILARLTNEQRWALLSVWSDEVQESAAALRPLAKGGLGSRVVVARGDDSTTWNVMARWFNTARANWYACLASVGALDHVTVNMALPKVLRVMAADLVRWHSFDGSDGHPDERVANLLPPVWDVLDGSCVCTRDMVIDACTAAGVDPETSGWLAVRGPRDPEPVTFTPELVHGVAVADPLVGALLRSEGVWAGPSKKPTRDIDPMVLAIAAEERLDGPRRPSSNPE